MIRHVALLAGATLLSVVFATALPAAVSGTGYSDWSAPVWLGPVVNSTASEAGPALSADGLSLYFYSNRLGGSGSDDIWVSQRPTVSAPWGAPVNVGPTINTTSRDFVPSFSPDGHWMFFASDRPGGFGGVDLYQSYRTDVHDDFGWQAPTNLGANVNTPAAENGNGYFDNGGHPQLYFGSDRLGPAGNSLFYVSDLQADGTWGPATAIPELGAGNRPSVRLDGLEIFFYSNRLGGQGGIDLWTATRATTEVPWSTPVNLGATVNTTLSDQHPYLSSDGTTLVFFSTRTGGSGGSDLWMTTRTDVTPPAIASHADVHAITHDVQATSVAVSYTRPDVMDNVDATHPADCSPASGSSFALGHTKVTCSATDAAGNRAADSFFDVFVEFVDNTAPVIAAHEDIHVLTGDFRGAVVGYTPPNATDDHDGTFAATCSPASGSEFSLGHTFVICSARDAAGNRAADSFFDVSVQLDADLGLQALGNDIDASSVAKGLRKLLTAKIDVVQNDATCKKVDAFVHQLDEHKGKEGLTATQAGVWRNWANAISDTLGC